MKGKPCKSSSLTVFYTTPNVCLFGKDAYRCGKNAFTKRIIHTLSQLTASISLRPTYQPDIARGMILVSRADTGCAMEKVINYYIYYILSNIFLKTSSRTK